MASQLKNSSPLKHGSLHHLQDYESESLSSEPIDTTTVGYDLIASVIENDVNITQYPNEFFEDLAKFRNENFRDCNKDYKSKDFTLPKHRYPKRSRREETHTQPLCCSGAGSYVVDERYQLTPVHGPYSDCATCLLPIKNNKIVCEEEECIRVSVPRGAIQTSTKMKPHRRRSFNAANSVSLASHCLSGWEAPRSIKKKSDIKIDLKSNALRNGRGRASIFDTTS